MRKLLWAVLAMGLVGATAQAGGPPGGPGGRVRDRMGAEFLGGRMGEFLGIPGARARTDIFDVARRYFPLTPEQQAAIGKLDDQRDTEQSDAIAELNKRLDKKFIALILEALPPEEKAKYEKVIAAITERDEAIEAARKEFRETLDKVRAAQGVEAKGPTTTLPFNRTDIIRRCLNLTEQQRTGIDQAGRDGWTAMREKMRNVVRPGDWRDADARRQFFEASRKAREEVDAQTAEAMVLLLNDEQKKAYQTAAAAMDAYSKKVKDAEAACEQKLIALVGAEKAKAATTPGPMPGTPPPPAEGPRPGEAPKPAEGAKPTQF
jgi:hypothetical protein